MTTIAMVEHANGVTIGYDSLVSLGSQQASLEASKVFVNGGIIFGVAGAVLDAQIIRYADLPYPDDEDWDMDRWVTNELIPAIKDALHKEGVLASYSSKIETDSTILAVVRGRVYAIYHDTGWIRRTDCIYTVGSGGNYAMGALAAGATMQRAMRVAAENDKGTGYELTVVESEELVGKR